MNVLDFMLPQKSRGTIEVPLDWLDDFGQVALATVVSTWSSAPVPIGGQRVLPLARAEGAGAEMRQSLGTAVFAGMLGGTFFGLLFTPPFYVLVRWLSSFLRRGTFPAAEADPPSRPEEPD